VLPEITCAAGGAARCLLIAEQGRSDVPACESTGFRRLAKLMGISWPAYLAAFDRCNALPCDEKWNYGGSQRAAEAIRELLAADLHRRVLLVGRRALVAWQPDYRRDLGHFDRLWWCPHPSGKNRWWNHETNLGLFELWARDFRERVLA
jgi:hypothetical protein